MEMLDDNVPLDVKFRIDSDQIDGNFDYRFLLSLTIDAFKSEVVSVTTPSHNHSGHTGSGEGAVLRMDLLEVGESLS